MSFPIVIDPFCFKQFNPSSSQYIPYDIQEFQKRLNDLYSPSNLKPGYAPFCKHLFIENFTEAKVSVLQISQQNQSLILSKYESRTEKELPVLVRWFPKELVGEIPRASILDIILYSYAQIQEENQARNDVDPVNYLYDWGVVGIKPQNEDYELPMQPITMMRNALGKEEGGSGVPIDRIKYLQSVEYWSNYCLVK
jgi:Protein of unknown function (DUF3228)